ncbi:MAG TPA: DUF4340 domain-containing protein [Clostridiaceae bacterium]|nr:DUF4340 domain-containing protein [Clostridiaceae bacterium]
MKHRHILTGIVFVVAAIAISLTYKLFADRELDEPPPSPSPPPLESRDVVSFFDDASDIREVIVRDGDYTMTFALGESLVDDPEDTTVPPQMNTEPCWYMADPKLKEPNTALIERTVKSLLNISGPVQNTEDLESNEGETLEEVKQALSDARFSITYHSIDESSVTISAIQTSDHWQDCYAMRDGGDEIVRIDGLFPLVTHESANFLNHSVCGIPRGAVSAVRLIRARDELDLSIKRITNPERADEIEATLLEQTEQIDLPVASDQTSLSGIEQLPENSDELTQTQQEEQSETTIEQQNPAVSNLNPYSDPATAGTNTTADEPLFFQLETDSTPADWQIVSPLEIHANAYNVTSLVQELSELEAREFVGLGDEEFPLYGLDEPSYRCIVQGLDINGQVRSDTILFGAEASNDDIYAYSSLLDAVFLCSRGSVRSLDTPIEDFIDQFPVRLPLFNVRYIDVLTPVQSVSCHIVKNQEGLQTEILFDDVPVNWSQAKRFSSLRQLYRGITDIQVSGIDLTAPSSEDVLYTVVIQSIADDIPTPAPAQDISHTASASDVMAGERTTDDDELATSAPGSPGVQDDELSAVSDDASDTDDIESDESDVSLSDETSTTSNELQTLVIGLQRRDESTWYIYCDGRYTGTYCQDSRLRQEEVNNYGMLAILRKLRKEFESDNPIKNEPLIDEARGAE